MPYRNMSILKKWPLATRLREDRRGNRRPQERQWLLERSLQPKKLLASSAALIGQIVEQRRTERALRESEAQKQAIFDGITTNIAFVNLDMEILWVNKAATASVGKTPEGMIGRRCYEFWGNSVKPCPDCPTLKAIQTKKPEHITVVTPDGRIWDEKGEPVFDPDGNLIGVVEIAEDITDRKRAEAKLQEYANRLEEMVEARTQALKKAQDELLIKERLAVMGHFAGSISHELRNPLAAIDTAAYLLKSRLDGDEKTRENLDRIYRNVRKADTIIQSLLDLSRVKKPDPSPHPLADIVSDSLKSAGVSGSPAVRRDFSDGRIRITGDREQIRMALTNLFRNAVEAMAGSDVPVAGSGELVIAARPAADGMVEITVTDTGPGFAEEHLDRLFEPLFSTKTHGFGFGLSIVRMVVENHGGAITARSEPGRGATFTLTLPLAHKEGSST